MPALVAAGLALFVLGACAGLAGVTAARQHPRPALLLTFVSWSLFAAGTAALAVSEMGLAFH